MHKDPERFKNLVQDRWASVDEYICCWLLLRSKQMHELFVYSLRRQVTAINKLSDAGLFFWDYGNAFLLEAMRAGNFLLTVSYYMKTI